MNKKIIIILLLMTGICRADFFYRLEKNGFVHHTLYLKISAVQCNLYLFQSYKGQIKKMLVDTVRYLNDSTIVGEGYMILLRAKGIQVTFKSKVMKIGPVEIAPCNCENLLNEDFNEAYLFENRYAILDTIQKITEMKIPRHDPALLFDRELKKSDLFKMISLPPDDFQILFNTFVDSLLNAVESMH